MKPIRVLHYGMTDNLGGVETFVFTMYRNIDRTKVQFDFLLDHNQKEIAFEDEIKSLGGRLFRVCYGIKESPVKAFMELDRFFKTYANEFSAVHLHSCFIGNSKVLKYAEKYGIPVRIYHSHNAGNMYPSSFLLKRVITEYEYRSIIRYATHLLACSNAAGKYMFRKCSFTVIPNAIDAEKFRFDPVLRERKRNQLGCAGQFTIGFIGRLQYQKNPLFLIEVMKKLNMFKLNFVCYIVGTGPMEVELRETVLENNLEQKIVFLGVRSDVAELYQAFDLFVLPSRFEGLPMVLVEAQANGLPCLVSDTITNEAFFSDNVFTCSLFKGPEYWANAIAETDFVRRDNAAEDIKKRGFDSNTQSRIMETFYLNESI